MRRCDNVNPETRPGLYFVDDFTMIMVTEGGRAYAVDLDPGEAFQLGERLLRNVIAVTTARAAPEADRQATAPPAYDA